MKKAKEDHIVQYLLDCYRHDHKSNHFQDITHKDIDELHLLDDSSVISGENDYLPVEHHQFDNISKLSKLYSKEKSLKGFFLVLKHKKAFLGKNRNIYTPVFTFDVELKTLGEFNFLQIDRDSFDINPAIYDVLKPKPNTTIHDINREFSELIEVQEGKYGNLFSFTKLLSNYFEEFDSSYLNSYPDFISFQKAKKVVINNDEHHLFPMAGFGLIPKPKGAIGIIHELEQIIRQKPNGLLQKLQTSSYDKNRSSKQHESIIVPALLSDAQNRILENAQNFDTSVIVGPPGTGKSFTIAALAINEARKGKKILIVSANPQAVKVVDEKIKSQFGLKKITTRYSSKRKFTSGLSKNLNNWLNGVGISGNYSPELQKALVDDKHLSNKIKKLKEELEKVERLEIKFGNLVDIKDKSLWLKIKTLFYKGQAETKKSYHELLQSVNQHLISRIEGQKKIIDLSFKIQLQNSLAKHRSSFMLFKKSLRAKVSGEKAILQSQIDFSKVIDAFPIWLTSLSDLHLAIPLQKEIFDVLIIDEASQVDIPSVIPAIFRSKKVVVCGDPKQLNHISFLSNSKQKELATAHHLSQEEYINYREDSILDFINEKIPSQDQVSFLDEHYRSLPDIISFSNTHFYDGSLRIMRDTPRNENIKGLHILNAKGSRNEFGINQIEAQKIIQKVKTIILEDQASPNLLKRSLGILSPFRDQVIYLQKEITQHLSIEEISNHQILISTAYGFQGEERDVMLISFVADDNSHAGSITYMNQPTVFNVSITRARNEQYIFHSFEYLKKEGMIFQFLTNLPNSNISSRSTSIAGQSAEKIQQWFLSLGYTVKTSEQIAGIDIDFLIEKEGKTLAIDLVGSDASIQKSIGLKSFRILQLLNINFYALTYSKVYYEPDKIAKEIAEMMKRVD